MESCSLITQDPNVIIVYQKEDLVIYMDLIELKSWVIWGKCDLCGACIEGAINPDLRPYTERKDIPTRPPIKIIECSLRGIHYD